MPTSSKTPAVEAARAAAYGVTCSSLQGEHGAVATHLRLFMWASLKAAFNFINKALEMKG